MKAIYDYVSKHPGERIPAIASGTQIAGRSVERHIKMLKDSKQIVFKGSSRIGGYYAVKTQAQEESDPQAVEHT